jgi:hypothetical protein
MIGNIRRIMDAGGIGAPTIIGYILDKEMCFVIYREWAAYETNMVGTVSAVDPSALDTGERPG